MQIEIAPDGNMTMDGRALLRSLQNESTPRLDLFVREALQNSLDAARDGREAELELRTGELATKGIARHLPEIGEEIQQRFGAEAPFLMLRDSGTEGLSGPVRYQDISGERGNLRKLVYEIAKPQDAEGAGGSWGLGKTVYFRMGIGLVIYYSRFRDPDTGRFHSRLAATLVEDQTAATALLPAGAAGRGIAWWGQRDPEYPDQGGTIPLTDENEIDAVLSDFGIAPYSGDETGTTVLIPFIDEKALLQETGNAADEEQTAKLPVPYWHYSVQAYLEIAVQRWYAPRLANRKDFGNRLLNITVNGAELAPEPLFALLQVLYHAALSGSGRFRGVPVSTKDLTLRGVFADRGAFAGRLSYIRLPKTELGVGTGGGKHSPYAHAGLPLPPAGRNPAIIAYTRRPGMIVSYETAPPWVPSKLSVSPDEYVVGIFVPAGDRLLADQSMPFEEYLRRSEEADHMGWQDLVLNGKKRTIVSRIQSKIRNELSTQLAPKEPDAPDIRTDLGLGRALGQVFMPPGGAGGWDRGRGGLSAGGGSGGTGVPKDNGRRSGPFHRGRNVAVRPAGNRIWSADSITVPFRLDFGAHDSAIMKIRIRTDGPSVAPDKWESETGSRPPVELLSWKIERVYAGKELVADTPESCRQQLQVSEERTPEGVLRGIVLTDRMADRRLSVEGLLTYRADSAEGELEAAEADR